MSPPRGLSMSAISRNEIDTSKGRTSKRSECDLWAPYPANRLQNRAINSIRAQADGGMRFFQAASVYPCEFSTSFIPETARVVNGVGPAEAGTLTAGQSFA